MHKVNWFGLYWIAWLLMFLVPEFWALMFYPADTLSEETWGLEQLSITHPFDVAQWTAIHWITAIVVWGLFAWLAVHLPFGLLR
jgi:hypothetical protein